jgi:hypothetical protein
MFAEIVVVLPKVLPLPAPTMTTLFPVVPSDNAIAPLPPGAIVNDCALLPLVVLVRITLLIEFTVPPLSRRVPAVLALLPSVHVLAENDEVS